MRQKKTTRRNRRSRQRRRLCFEPLALRLPMASDFGDAPDLGGGSGLGDYRTLSTDNGPSHVVPATPLIFLGSGVDTEVEALPNAGANGDDVDAALPDDEDGVVTSLDLLGTEGVSPTITVLASNNSGSAGTLNGWIDYNQDGVFDNASERAQIAVPDGTTAGRFELSFPVIPVGSVGQTYLRLRLSTDAAAADPTGVALDGEVEDHVFSITSPTPFSVVSEQKITSLDPQLATAVEDGDWFGTSVAAIGDLNGDGVTDLAVGAYGTDSLDDSYNAEGALFILLMNADGSVGSQHEITELNAPRSNKHFSKGLAAIGDLDADGVPDVAVGSQGDVWILLMNPDGTVKSSQEIAPGTGGFVGSTDTFFFGSSVAALGDLDGDGITELAVGNPGAGPQNAGGVYILFMNADGTVRSEQEISDNAGGLPTPLPDLSYFGASVAALGDLNGDGIPDMAMGGWESEIRVLLLNADGTVQTVQAISETEGGFDGDVVSGFNDDDFGYALSSPGDLDGDGIADLLAGAPHESDLGYRRGAIWALYLNADGTVKSEDKISDAIGAFTGVLDDEDYFGHSVNSLGDLNNDGFIDIAVGAILDDDGGYNRGAVWLLSLGTNYDFGDAPDTDSGVGPGNYQTLLAHGGPQHLSNDFLFLGGMVDVETDASSTPQADGDDNDQGADDEDGLLDPFDLSAVQGTSPTITLAATNTTGSTATLYGWIDINQDGVFDSATERADITVPDGSIGTRFSLSFPTLPFTVVGDTYARFRLSTDAAAANPNGFAIDGEVEDYPFTINVPAAGVVNSQERIGDNDGGFTGELDLFDAFGTAVSPLGDLNGDGIVDLAVGAPFDDDEDDDTGAVWVLFMNADGTVNSHQKISDIEGGFNAPLAEGASFGTALALAGDTTGDGLQELFVGAASDNGRGSIYRLFLNSDGTVSGHTELSDITGGLVGNFLTGDRFGSSVTSPGDLNGDGNVDVAVGADGDGAGDEGAIWMLLLNQHGTVESEVKIGSNQGGFTGTLDSGDNFGSGLTSLGDVNGDGIADLAVGAKGDSDSGVDRGAVWVLFMNADGTVQAHQKINETEGGFTGTLDDEDNFGVSLTSAGDMNADGVPDLIVGATGDDDGGVDTNYGAAWVLFLNSDGTVKANHKISNTQGAFAGSIDEDGYLGSALAAIGDVNGDGTVDLAVGANGGKPLESGVVWRVTLAGPFDFGDAPDPALGATSGDYQTTLADDGPLHLLVNSETTLFLGASVDSDSGLLQDAAATGDDIDGTFPGDENGVLDPLELSAARGTAPSVTLLATNNIGSQATLSGWIDYNADGIFDNATERAQATVPDGSTDAYFTLTFPGIPFDAATNTYARFRLSTDGAGENPTGGAVNGEVEDYAFTTLSPTKGTVAAEHKIDDGAGGLLQPLSNFDNFGRSIAPLGDFDGDGINDIVVGADGDDGAGGIFADRGAVHVLRLNSDGTVKISAKVGNGFGDDGDAFGRSVTSLGDFNGDGVTDIAVGSPGDDDGGSDRGAVHLIFLQPNGTLDYSLKISSTLGGFTGALADGDRFGSAVTSLGDLDGDGITDIAVGAEGDDENGSNRGAFWILFLNSDGTVRSHQKVNEVSGNFAGVLNDADHFGSSLAAVGDVDRDGVTDLAVGARFFDGGGINRGAVWVVMLNADGTVKSQQEISEVAGGFTGQLDDLDSFGFSVGAAGDLNGDGVPDLLAGSRGDDEGGFDRGAAWVLMLNSDGTVQSASRIAHGTGGFGATLNDSDEFGSSVTAVGDLNGDGLPDLAVGARGDNGSGVSRGAVWILNLDSHSLIVENTDDSGPGSLRQAIADANATPGFDVIQFDIPGAGPHTIQPLSALPAIIEPALLDATTEPDYAGTPVVEIDGSSAGLGTSGLSLVANGSTIRGLAINRFDGNGILVTGDGNIISQNMIGTDPAGTVALPNGVHGVNIFDSADNLIGGPVASDGNVISGNAVHGILISQAAATNNLVLSNTIGLGRDGATQLGNGGSGVRVSQGASDNQIGGSGNIISANGSSGVVIVGTSSTNNTLAGNKIGTDATGELDRGNGGGGVTIDDAPNNTIGLPGDGNLISGNAKDGIFISGVSGSGNVVQANTVGLNVTGDAALPNGQNGISLFEAPGNTLGGTADDAGNLISGNNQTGIFIAGSGASGNRIEGNFVGTDATGTTAVPNGQFGVVVRDAPNNTVGGLTPSAGNLVSGNTLDGVAILNPLSTGNVVAGNLIGTDKNGTAGLGNLNSGVLIWKAPSNRVGGVTNAERNIISGNGLYGVRVSTSLASGNSIEGNYIGTDINAAAAVPNTEAGVQLANAQHTTVGGDVEGAGNVVSGNGSYGILLTGAGTANNLLQGNTIGLDSSGALSIGNGDAGVRVAAGARDNTIGGVFNSTGNVISGNDGDGVLLVDAGTHSNLVAGNLIGTDASGVNALGNTGSGVAILHADTNTIGDSAAGTANLISGNGLFGVLVFGANAIANVVEGNGIGTDVSGTRALGNGSTGVFVSSPNNRIGGVAPGSGNLISGNGYIGVRISGASATGNRIEGNLIGTQIDGTSPLGNIAEGIRIDDSTDNAVGGTAAGAANVIAHNTTHGVAVVGNSAGNAIQHNSIFANDGLGIDLGLDGVTANDTTAGSEDSDTNPNNLQNTPAISAAVLAGDDLEVTYSVPSSTAHAAYPLRVEIYLADAFGQQGQTFLSADVYEAGDALNPAVFTIDVTGLGLSTASQIVGTATDSAGNTSEFSTSAAVSLPLRVASGSVLSAEACRAFRPEATAAGDEPDISDEAFQFLVDAGIDFWRQQGTAPEQVSQLNTIDVRFADLGGGYLGLTTGNTIMLDTDAAGFGWYFDPLPEDDWEVDDPTSPANSRMDLLTAIAHEMGHVLGYADVVDDDLAEDIMFAWLRPGERRGSRTLP